MNKIHYIREKCLKAVAVREKSECKQDEPNQIMKPNVNVYTFKTLHYKYYQASTDSNASTHTLSSSVGLKIYV